MERPTAPQIKEAPPAWAERYGGRRMLIPTPRMVAEVIRKIPRGKVMTMGQLRHQLAAQASADFACPLTTGIFLRIVAEADEEARREGRPPIAPYWRVVKDDGSLHPKFPGGAEQHHRLLAAEGVPVAVKGKKRKVAPLDDFRYTG